MPSIPTTSWPASISRWATWKPMKPAVPVTRKRTVSPSVSSFGTTRRLVRRRVRPKARLGASIPSRLDDVGRRHPGAGAGVARVDDERRVFDQRAIVDVVVVGCDQDRIVVADRFRVPGDRRSPGKLRMLAGRWNRLHVRIMEVDRGAALLQQLDQFEGGALANVFDILLVGDADHQDLRAAQAAAGSLVEAACELVDDVLRHRGVDLAGKLDEARRDIELPRLPGQIKRIDRDAVAAQSWAGIKRHESKRL